MKIKHWQGYGSLNARLLSVKKVSCADIVNYGRPMEIKRVLIEGNHERGIEIRDRYDIFNWLVKRFCKSITYDKLGYVGIEESGYKKVSRNGRTIDEEYAVYNFNYFTD